LLAQVLTAKYCDHTPLYRQSQIFARHGVELSRITLAGWVGGTCWWLEALHDRLARKVARRPGIVPWAPLSVVRPVARNRLTRWHAACRRMAFHRLGAGAIA
jgi:hypothetical protein